MVTVNGKPYWADAIGQIPYAVDFYKKGLKRINSPTLVKGTVNLLGGFAAEGDPIKTINRIIERNPDTSNSYDNAMIEDTGDWMEDKYYVSAPRALPRKIENILKKNGNTLDTIRSIKRDDLSNTIDTTDYLTKKLFNYNLK